MEDEKLIALLDEKFAEVNARFDGVNARFDGVNARFDGVDGQFEGVNARFDGVDGQVEGVNSRLGYLETEVRKLRVDAHENNVKIERNNELIFAVDQKLGSFRTETAGNFKDVKQMLGVSNRGLVSRIRKLEKKAS